MKRAFPPLLLVISLLGGCTSGEAPGPQACALPSPLKGLSLLPEDIPLDQWGRVDRIEVENGFLAARAVTESRIVELYPVIARATSEAGYTILSGDNEGFEAEIFFDRGKGTTGTYRLRQGPCRDQVTIYLLYEADRYRRLS
jgi:hypothetical protein